MDITSIEAGILTRHRPSLYETADTQSAANEFIFSDVQIQDMLSQNIGLQPPWNLDDIGWGSMISQNYS